MTIRLCSRYFCPLLCMPPSDSIIVVKIAAVFNHFVILIFVYIDEVPVKMRKFCESICVDD